jgi:hypothetical protein
MNDRLGLVGAVTARLVCCEPIALAAAAIVPSVLLAGGIATAAGAEATAVDRRRRRGREWSSLRGQRGYRPGHRHDRGAYANR